MRIAHSPDERLAAALAVRVAQLAGAEPLFGAESAAREPSLREDCVLAVIEAQSPRAPARGWAVLGIADPPETSALRWRVERSGAHWLGSLAGGTALRCALGVALPALTPAARALAARLALELP